MDEDLRELMLNCLEIEKAAVAEDLHEYCSAIVILLTPSGRYVRRPEFFDEDEKIAAYREIVSEAKSFGATVIVTVNAARTKKLEAGEEDGYWWGKLESEQARDCISITASGPNMRSCALDLGYDIEDGFVHFDPDPEFRSTEVGMLPDWPGEIASLAN
jgi:hypothetical protein